MKPKTQDRKLDWGDLKPTTKTKVAERKLDWGDLKPKAKPMEMELTGGMHENKEGWLPWLGKSAEDITLGAGDSVKNLLSLGYAKPYTENIKGISQLLSKGQDQHEPNKDLNDAYSIGHTIGDISSFLGGGSILKSGYGGVKGAQKLVELLSKIPGHQGLGRIAGSAAFESAESPEERTKGALKGAALGGLGEAAMLPFKAVGALAEKMNPIKGSSKLQDYTAKHASRAKKEMEGMYNEVLEKHGRNIVSDKPEHLLGYHDYEKKYFTPDVRKIYGEFLAHPTFSNLHNLQSQMGKDAASMRFTPSKTNTYQTLNRLRNEIHETHIPEALKSDKNALKKYNEAKNFAHKEYYPFITGKNLQKVSEGITNTLSPKQFNSAIQKAIESRQMAKAAIHGKHPLIKALKSGTKAVQKGEALQDSMPLISALMGAVGGPFGAATGGTLGHFVLPHALKLAQNAYVNKNGERVHKAIRAALAEAGNRTNQNTPMELTLIGGHKK